MKKLILIFILLLVSVSVFGAHTVIISEDTKYTVSGTVNNDYNEGVYRIDKGISGVFELEVDEPVEHNFTILFEKNTGEEYKCLSYILSNANDTIYDRCTIYPNSTGVYNGVLEIDGEPVYFETMTVKDASLPTLGVILGILALIGIVLSLTVSPYVWLITVLLGLGSFISFMFRYKYVMDDALFFGIFSFVFLVLAVVGEKMLEQLFK